MARDLFQGIVRPEVSESIDDRSDAQPFRAGDSSLFQDLSGHGHHATLVNMDRRDIVG